MRSTTTALALFALGSSSLVRAQKQSVDALRTQWNLDAADFSFGMPSDTLGSDDAQDWITDKWDLAQQIDWGGNDM